jgi:hypothetical protein
MADDDRIKVLEDRLTRLEAVLTQRPPTGGGGTTTPPGGVVVDPAPWGGGGSWGGGWVRPTPFPSPVVDPAPWWTGWGRPRWPTPVVDPAPWPTAVVDPAPSPWGGVMTNQAAASSMALGRIGHVGDPPPFDFSTLSVSQLESTLHTINAEKARLDSMETMVKQQLERAKQKGKG